MYFLGVDIGTTNIKAALFSGGGERVAERTCRNEAVRPWGWDALDADALTTSVKRLVRETCAGRGAEVAALGFASMAETLLPVGSDPDKGALSPGIYWYETCTLPQFERLLSRIGPKEIHRLTALNPSWIYSASKVMKLRDDFPDVYEKTRAFLDVSSFMAWLMTGEAGFDSTLACRTLLLDVQRARWSPVLFSAAELDIEKFPPLKKPGEIRGILRPELAGELGLNPAAVVVTGGQDHIAAAFGAGVQGWDEAMVSIGTSAAFYVPADTACYLTDAFLERFYLAGGYSVFPGSGYILTGLSAGGFCVDWFVHRILRQDYSMLEGMRPQRTRALFLPNLRSQMEGFPPGGFTALSDEDTGETLLQAIMESLAFECRVTLEEARRAREPADPSRPRRIVVVGGAVKNKLLMDLIASVLDCPLELHPLPQSAAALGAARAAAEACGRRSFGENGPRERVEPSLRPEFSEYLEEKYLKHLEHFRSVKRPGLARKGEDHESFR